MLLQSHLGPLSQPEMLEQIKRAGDELYTHAHTPTRREDFCAPMPNALRTQGSLEVLSSEMPRVMLRALCVSSVVSPVSAIAVKQAPPSAFMRSCVMRCRRVQRRPILEVTARGSRQTRLATRITTIPRRVDLYFADRPLRRVLWAAISFYSGFYCANTGRSSAQAPAGETVALRGTASTRGATEETMREDMLGSAIECSLHARCPVGKIMER